MSLFTSTPCFRAPLLAMLLLTVAGCRRPESPASMDCREDFDCLIQRAQRCQPASVLLRQAFTVDDKPVQVLARYEVVSRVREQCHVRRTQLEPLPPPPPDAGQVEEPLSPYEFPNVGRPVTPAPHPGEMLPPQLQCLYPEKQVAEVLRRVQQGESTQADLDLCYPGDGGCDATPIPLFAPGCVLGDCLLGRWTFTCEDPKDPKHDISYCEGTRLSDENPGCTLRCRKGQFELKCRKKMDAADGQKASGK